MKTWTPLKVALFLLLPGAVAGSFGEDRAAGHQGAAALRPSRGGPRGRGRHRGAAQGDAGGGGGPPRGQSDQEQAAERRAQEGGLLEGVHPVRAAVAVLGIR
eukprot:8264191-Pyramimonas_sp.AAC.2